MEEISKTSITTISRDKNKAPDQNGLPLTKKRKRASAIRLLKVTLYALGLRSSKSKSKSIQVNLLSKFSWKGLVGSMRPMHLQSNQSPPPAIEAEPAMMPEAESIPLGKYVGEEISSPLSPMRDSSPSPVFSMSSYGSVSDMSQYESPLNLSDLQHVIKSCEEITQEPEFWYGDDDGDEMIDAKAEEFIAQFYEQMRRQNLNE
ncbi:PREDICTED: uncharacterized protein LOC18613659 [Theobroma cacao]|uniref:Uncharacterized protein LOC18613659 n=1 Tax=Theobroma cacao TaxID=3641 RepID=A0AB32WH42_THECC|nr:PREDICTED: uncharacterized protein LOC18613659 [Theobroma cacao]